MISKESYTLEYIEYMKGSRKVDKTILERTIYALSLLEALARAGLPFIFKGGTSLLLLLDSPKRLSTDIDIIVKPGTDFEHYLIKASKIFPFRKVEEQERQRKGSLEKRHYKFTYDSPAYGREFYILLDVLFEENHYAQTIQKPIKNSLIISEEPYVSVTVPTAECIMGDKLTAFAPHTTGIPFGIGKELEIIKQMYDVSCLFDVTSNSTDVYKSYMETVKSEIKYRGIDITYQDVLLDTIEAAACVAGKGLIGEDYPLYFAGIKAIKEHVFDERFTAELAVGRACKVMYVAACLLSNTDMKKIDDPRDYLNLKINNQKYRNLYKIRKFEPQGYAYSVEAINRIERLIR